MYVVARPDRGGPVQASHIAVGEEVLKKPPFLSTASTEASPSAWQDGVTHLVEEVEILEQGQPIVLSAARAGGKVTYTSATRIQGFQIVQLD